MHAFCECISTALDRKFFHVTSHAHTHTFIQRLVSAVN